MTTDATDLAGHLQYRWLLLARTDGRWQVRGTYDSVVEARRLCGALDEARVVPQGYRTPTA